MAPEIAAPVEAVCYRCQSRKEEEKETEKIEKSQWGQPEILADRNSRFPNTLSTHPPPGRTIVLHLAIF
jgi:hypothetical protein